MSEPKLKACNVAHVLCNRVYTANHCKQQKLELLDEVEDIIETERELNGAYEKVNTLKQRIEDE